MSNAPIYHIPILRLGREYTSLDQTEIKDVRGGGTVATMSMANAGLIRRDFKAIDASRQALADVPINDLLDMCEAAAEIFINDDLPMASDGPPQSPEDYVTALSATCGLPKALVRMNMKKVQGALAQSRTVLQGLSRGLDLASLDKGVGEQGGVAVSFYPTTESLGVILPSNSPGVNSLWLPAIPLKIPLLLKPGREEPWTPLRLIRAMVKAGIPATAFGFYPTTHDGAGDIMRMCGRAMIFGSDKTVDQYAGNPRVQVHGPGRSKILIGEDYADRWEECLDVIVASIADNSGRSCINASTVVTPRHGRAIAEALAERLAERKPLPLDDAAATLAGFSNPQVAEWIDESLNEALAEPGATDVSVARRGETRRVELDGSTYLLPTIAYCESPDHALANTEYMFPFAGVVEMPQSEMLDWIGPTLVVTALTEDAGFSAELLASPHIERLNIGAWPTSRVNWDQPHEGNLFELLYKRRSIYLVSAK